MERTVLGRLQKTYFSLVLTLANTLVIFIFANVGIGLLYFVKDSVVHGESASKAHASKTNGLFNLDGSPVDNGKRGQYQLEWFDFNAYENIRPEYAAAVLDDFYELSKLGMSYQPWVQFAEPLLKGSLVNVEDDERGFPSRRTINPSNDQGLPVVEILTLGGSTTFGYNVSDAHTWPSYLSKILNQRARTEELGIRIKVTNYGRGFYNTSQETILLIDLLKGGHRPNLVIFMDGLNWPAPQDVPYFTGTFQRQFKNMQFVTDTPMLKRLQWLPFFKLAHSIQHKLSGTETEETKNKAIYLTANIINRFEQNEQIARAVCNLYSVKPLFFVQPNAIYNYPIQLYRRPLPAAFKSEREATQDFYRRMRNRKGIIYLGDLFESWGPNRKAIVDEVHYSPGFNEFLARHVADYIDLKMLVPRRQLVDEAAATGARRDLSEFK